MHTTSGHLGPVYTGPDTCTFQHGQKLALFHHAFTWVRTHAHFSTDKTLRCSTMRLHGSGHMHISARKKTCAVPPCVYTGPDTCTFQHGQKLARFHHAFTRVRTHAHFSTDKNLRGSTMRLHGTGGTGRIFERLSMQVWNLQDNFWTVTVPYFIRTCVNTRTVELFALIAWLRPGV